MQIKVKVDNKWVEIPTATEITDNIVSDKLTYSSSKIESLVNEKITLAIADVSTLIGEVVE